MPINLPPIDPDDVKPYFAIWCDKDGTNDGSAAIWCDKDGTNDGSATDDGKLQGATISTTEWTVPSGITKDSDNTDAVTIRGVSYGVSTVATIWLSSGTVGEHTLTNKITTSDSRTLSQSITIEVKEN
jgi:hypothetical protein